MTPEQEFNQCIKEVAEFIKEIDKLEAKVLDSVVACKCLWQTINVSKPEGVLSQNLCRPTAQALSFYFPNFILWGRN